MEETMDKKTESVAMPEEQEIRYKELSPAQMVARRFFRSRLSLVGLLMLVALFVSNCFFAIAFFSLP